MGDLGFVQSLRPGVGAAVGPRPAVNQQQMEAPAFFAGASGPSATVLASVVAAGLAMRNHATQRRATAVKKKGVKVVEGREIPWNLFAPKAPYKAKCISNETITTKTDLVNWQTCHVVID